MFSIVGDTTNLENQTVNENGLTPLAVSVKYHHLKIAEFLIAKGSNVNALNKVCYHVYLIM